jgi:hypothetical protein
MCEEIASKSCRRLKHNEDKPQKHLFKRRRDNRTNVKTTNDNWPKV